MSATPFPLRLLDVERLDPLLELRLAALRFDAVLALRLVVLRFAAVLPLRLVVLRFAAVLALRFDPLPAALDRLLEDRAVVFADGLRAVDFLEVVDRFVLLRGVFPAIAFSSIWRPDCLPIALPKQGAKDATCENLQRDR